MGDLTDLITTINVPVVGSAEFARGRFFMEWGISEILSPMEATIFVKKTVKELLFDGYEDTVMHIGSSFRNAHDDDASEKIVLDKFGWFYKVILLLYC